MTQPLNEPEEHILTERHADDGITHIECAVPDCTYREKIPSVAHLQKVHRDYITAWAEENARQTKPDSLP